VNRATGSSANRRAFVKTAAPAVLSRAANPPPESRSRGPLPPQGPPKADHAGHRDRAATRRAFSLIFRVGLYPLLGWCRADLQQHEPPAGRRHRFFFSECRIGAGRTRSRRRARGSSATAGPS
jgi:hypothetical protein